MKELDKTVKDIFDEECKHLEINTNLLKRIHNYRISFAHKNQEHVEFFGGNLTGANVVRFMPTDRDKWFDEILEVDDTPLEEMLHRLTIINSDWHISSDTMNLSCVWLAHTIFVDKKFSDKQKHDSLIDIFLVLQYKYLTSILFRFFIYPADRSEAEATYVSLNNKYSLKTAGSWQKFLEMRAEEIIAKHGTHYNTIAKMDDDKRVIYILNDTQCRLKDTIKNIYAAHLRVQSQGIKITTTSAVITNHEGEEILKDKSRSLTTYSRYINSIITDKNSFIHVELTNIIEKLIYTMPAKLFHTTLEWMSDNYRQSGAGEIEELINNVMIHTWDYVAKNRDLIKDNTDLAKLLGNLRGVYMSARSTDPTLMTIRKLSEKIVRDATDNKNDSVISATKTGICLYIVLRALTMKHYG